MKKSFLYLITFLFIVTHHAQPQSSSTDMNGLTVAGKDLSTAKLSLEKGGNPWESIGPFGGDVLDIAIDPTNSSRVFLAAGYPYMRSESTEPWQITQSLLNLSPSGIHSLEANDAGVIFAGGQSTFGKIFKSFDQGETWQQEVLGVNATVLNIALAPGNQDIMYVCTSSNISGSTNKVLIKSTDGGDTWSPLDMTNWFPIGMGCNDLTVDPDNSDLVVALGDGGFSYPPKAILSSDGGTTWQDITAGLPSGRPFNEVTIHDGTIYICGGQLFGGQTMGIYKSENNGSSWQDVSLGFPIKVVNDLLINGDDPELMYAATEGDGVYYSVDGGSSWNYDTGGAGDNGSCRKIIFDPTDFSQLYAGFLSLGLCFSDNGGEDYSSSSVGIASLKLNDIEIDPSNPDIILASFEAENSGGCYLYDPVLGDWGLVSSLPATRFSSVSIGIDGRMYAWSNGPTTVAAEGVYRSSDGGETWENMGPNIGSVFETQIFSMVLSETDPNLIFIGGNNFGANGWASMIYRSADAGENWENVFMGPENDGFKYLFIDPSSDDQVVYAAYKSESADAGFLKSIDGGDNWLPINAGIPSNTKWGGAIICDNANPDILYGGAGGYGGTAGTIYKSENGGGSWTTMNISMSNNYSKITDMLLSPLNPSIIYAATSINGVYMTEDGENWLPASDGLVTGNITGFSRLFENDEEELGFYASSFSNSAFYSTIYEPGTIGFAEQTDQSDAALLLPNPASTSVTIILDKAAEALNQISIYSLQGNRVYSETLKDDSQGRVSFSTQNLSPGVYQAVIKTSSTTITKKLVIVN